MWISDRFFLRRVVQKATQLKGILCRRRRVLGVSPYWVLFGTKKQVRFAEPEGGDTNPNAPQRPADSHRSLANKWRKYVQDQFRVLRSLREDSGGSGGGGVDGGGGGGVRQRDGGGGGGGKRSHSGGGGPNPPSRGRFVQGASSTDDERQRRPPQEYLGLEVEDDPSLERLLSYEIPGTDPKRRPKAVTRRSRDKAGAGAKGIKKGGSGGSINSRTSSGGSVSGRGSRRRRRSKTRPRRRRRSSSGQRRNSRHRKKKKKKKKRKRAVLTGRDGTTAEAQPPSFGVRDDDGEGGSVQQLTSSGSPSWQAPSSSSTSICAPMNDTPSGQLVPGPAALLRGRYQYARLEMRALASRAVVDAEAGKPDDEAGEAGQVQLPKRPPNAFMIFTQRCRQEFRHLTRARVDARTLSVLLGNVWRFMSKQERQVFYDEAEVRRQHYQENTKQQQRETTTQEETLKRPPNAFVFYCQDQRSLIQPPGHGVSSRDFLKECARRWRRLKASQKRLYQQRAQRAQTLYLSRQHHLLHTEAAPPPTLEERPPVLAIEYVPSNDELEPTSVVTENLSPEAAVRIQATVPSAGTEEQHVPDLPPQYEARGLEFTSQIDQVSPSSQPAARVFSDPETDDGKTEFTEFAAEGHVGVVGAARREGVPSATPRASGPEEPHSQRALPALIKPGHRPRMGRNNNKLFTDSSDTDSASQTSTLGQTQAATAGEAPPPSNSPSPHGSISLRQYFGLGYRRRQSASMPPARKRHLQGRAVSAARAAAALSSSWPASAPDETGPVTAEASQSCASVEQDVISPNLAFNNSGPNSDLSVSCGLEEDGEDQGRKRKRKKKMKKKKIRCPHSHDQLERNVHWKDEATRWGTCAVCDPVTSSLCDEDVAHALLPLIPHSIRLPSSACLRLPSQQQTAAPQASFGLALRRECNVLRKPAYPASCTASLDSLHVASGETARPNNPLASYRFSAGSLCQKDTSLSSLQSSRCSSSCVSIDYARVRIQTAALKAHLDRLQSVMTHLSLSSTSSSDCTCNSFIANQTLANLAVKAQAAGLRSYYSNNCLPSSTCKGSEDRPADDLACELRSRQMITISPGLTAGLFCLHSPCLPVLDIIRGCSCNSKIDDGSGTGSSNQESSTSVDDVAHYLFGLAALKNPCTQSSSVDASDSPVPTAVSTSRQIENSAKDSSLLPLGDTKDDTRGNELQNGRQDNDGVQRPHNDVGKKPMLREVDVPLGVTGSLGKTTLLETKEALCAHFLAHKSAFQKVATGKRSSDVSVVSMVKPRMREDCDRDRYRFQPIKESYSGSSSFEELKTFRPPEDSVQGGIKSNKYLKKAEVRPLHLKDYNQSSLNCDGGLGSINSCNVPRAFSLDAEEDLCFQMDPMMIDFLQDLACESFPSFSTTESWLGVESSIHLSGDEIELDCLLEMLGCEDLLLGSSYSLNMLFDDDYAQSSSSLDTMPSTLTLTSETGETTRDLDPPVPKLTARLTQASAPSHNRDAIAYKRRSSTKRKASPGALAIVDSSNNFNRRAPSESSSCGLPKYPSLDHPCRRDGCLCSGVAGSTSVRPQGRGSTAVGHCRRRRRRRHNNNSDTGSRAAREPKTTQADTQLDLLHEPSEVRRPTAAPAWLADCSLPRFLEVEYCLTRGWI